MKLATARRLGEPGFQDRLLELAPKADFNICALRSEVEEIIEAYPVEVEVNAGYGDTIIVIIASI